MKILALIKIILLTIIYLLIISNSILAIDPIILTDEKGEYPIGLYLEILEDEDGKLTFEDVRKPEMESLWVKSKWDAPSFGFTKTIYWARFKIQSLPKFHYILEITYPHLDKINFYYSNIDGKIIHKETGDFFPFQQREILYRNFTFQLNPNDTNNKIYYLRFESGSSMQFPMNIWSPNAFTEMITTEMVGFGLYFGVMIVMALYNFFIWMSVRDKSYIYYVCYIFFNILLLLNYNGLNFQYFWFGSPILYNQLIPTSFFCYANFCNFIHISFSYDKK